MTASPDASPGASSLEGAVLDGWRLEARIGRGGMGEVWSARHVERDEAAAVKVIFARPDRRAEAARRFEREVRAASKIGHPGIVRVLGFGIDEARDGAMYIVMERLEGEPLRAWLDRATELDRREGLALVRELLDALAAAHACVDADGAAAPIIHRDLKPENVFVGPEGSAPRVKLLDFGIARQADAAPVTDTGVGMGTAAYMSPEQATDARAVGPASDVWSIGVMLYELLAGVRPFEAPSKNEVISRILTSDPVPLEEVAPGIAPSLARLVGRCLAKDPRRRPADAAALARALDPIATDAPSLGVPAGGRDAASLGQTTRDPAPARRSNGAWIAMGALAAVAAALVAVRFGALEGLARPTPERARGGAATPPPVSPGPIADAATLVNDANRFVAVTGGDHPLGLAADEPDDGVSGFRPRAGVRAPAEPFAIHAHEVTWAELEAWLAREGRAAPEVLGAARPAWLPENATARARLPATGVPWSLARDYCAAIGGALPTEEQWEHAARGASRRPYAWGDAAPPDEPARVAPVMSRPHDRTPGTEPIWDLTGNAREWTADLFRASDDGAVGAWASSEGRTFRAVRGLPLLTTSRWRPPSSAPIAHRVPLCATGPCPDGTDAVRLDVGFRCARR